MCQFEKGDGTFDVNVWSGLPCSSKRWDRESAAKGWRTNSRHWRLERSATRLSACGSPSCCQCLRPTSPRVRYWLLSRVSLGYLVRCYHPTASAQLYSLHDYGHKRVLSLAMHLDDEMLWKCHQRSNHNFATFFSHFSRSLAELVPQRLNHQILCRTVINLPMNSHQVYVWYITNLPVVWW